MIFVPYKDMTKEEKIIQQETWVTVLDGFCPADEYGCRPCDHGCPCDTCHYDWSIQEKYAHALVDKLTRLPEGMEKYFKEVV